MGIRSEYQIEGSTKDPWGTANQVQRESERFWVGDGWVPPYGGVCLGCGRCRLCGGPYPSRVYGGKRAVFVDPEDSEYAVVSYPKGELDG